MSSFDAIRNLRSGDYESATSPTNEKLSIKEWIIGGASFIGVMTFSAWVGIAQALSTLLVIGMPLGAGAALIDKGFLWIGIPLFILGPVVALALFGKLAQMCVFPVIGLLCLWMVLAVFGVHGDIQGYIASAPFLVGVIWLIGLVVGLFKWGTSKVMAR